MHLGGAAGRGALLLSPATDTPTGRRESAALRDERYDGGPKRMVPTPAEQPVIVVRNGAVLGAAVLNDVTLLLRLAPNPFDGRGAWLAARVWALGNEPSTR